MFECVNEREGQPRCWSGASYYDGMDFDAMSYVVADHAGSLSLSSPWTKGTLTSRSVASEEPGGRFLGHGALTAQLCE